MKKETPICHHCARADGVKKHGIGNTGNQRYFCRFCKRTFQTRYIYRGNEENMAMQIKKLLSQGHTPEQISSETQVRLQTVNYYAKEMESAC